VGWCLVEGWRADSTVIGETRHCCGE
jgi:hypothetical protein